MTTKQNSIVSEKELNDIYQEMVLKSSSTGLDPYDTYIQECRLNESSKKNSEGRPLPGVEKHHIIPRFDGGTDALENLILLNVKEHVIAHWIRWKVKKQSPDYRAYLFRVGNTEEALELQKKAISEAREKDRVEKKGFFDSDFQREMGVRGGGIGGSKNTEAQFLARQQVGKTYGRITGIGNQSDEMKIFLSEYSIWLYNSKSARKERPDTPEAFYCLISPKDAFEKVIKALESFVPGQITNKPSLYKLVTGEKSQLYGWKIVSKITRNEVREGILKFIQENPDVTLHFEENFAIEEGFE